MATSQNGWHVFFNAPAGLLRWITGHIRSGGVETVFDYLCSRLNDVETNKPAWSWGWAVRAIRGQTSGYSNHASGTAVDYNAPAHPLGIDGTWTMREIEHINTLLTEMGGVVRWGQNYSGRKDGMHFEINKGRLAVLHLAWKIKRGKMPDQKPDWSPRDAKAIHFGRVQEQFLIAVGAQEGEIDRLNGIGIIQEALNQVLVMTDLEVDGIIGKATLEAWKRWEDKVDGTGRPRVPDRKSVEALAKRAKIDIVGEPWDK